MVNTSLLEGFGYQSKYYYSIKKYILPKYFIGSDQKIMKKKQEKEFLEKFEEASGEMKKYYDDKEVTQIIKGKKGNLFITLKTGKHTQTEIFIEHKQILSIMKLIEQYLAKITTRSFGIGVNVPKKKMILRISGTVDREKSLFIIRKFF